MDNRARGHHRSGGARGRARGSPDGPSYYGLRFESGGRSRPNAECDSRDLVAILPRKTASPFQQTLIVPGIARPRQRVTVELHPSRGAGPWCPGRYKLELYTAYYLAPGPGSDEVTLEDLAKLYGRVR